MDDSKKEIWKKIGSSLGKLAPTIGTILGGPLVGAGASIVVDAIGGSVDKPEEIEARLSELTPEQLVALKQADSAWKVKLADIEINEQTQLTERLRLDNATNSRAIQFLRPAFGYTYLVLGVYLIISGWHGLFSDGFISNMQDRVFDFAESTTKTVVGFYFGSRGVEKVAAIVGNRFGSNPMPQVDAPLLRALIEKIKSIRS